MAPNPTSQNRTFTQPARFWAGLAALLAIPVAALAIWLYATRPYQQPSFLQALQHSHRVDIIYFRQPDAQVRFGDTAAMLIDYPTSKDPKYIEQSHLIALLRQCNRLHTKRETPRGNLCLQIAEKLDSPPYEYNYNSTTGELGSGNDWCYVPERFRQWSLTVVPNFYREQAELKVQDQVRRRAQAVAEQREEKEQRAADHAAWLIWLHDNAQWMHLGLDQALKTCTDITIDLGAPDPHTSYMTMAEVFPSQMQGNDPSVAQNRMLFASLRSSGGFHSRRRSAQPPDFTVLISQGQLETRMYGYVSATGELGAGDQWCYAPADFKSFMQERKQILPGTEVLPTHGSTGKILTWDTKTLFRAMRAQQALDAKRYASHQTSP